MSRRGAPRGKPMPPLALILLAAFIAIPFVLYFVPNRWWYGEFGPPPRLVVEMMARWMTSDEIYDMCDHNEINLARICCE